MNSKLVPDYYTVIKFPVDLHTMKDVSELVGVHVSACLGEGGGGDHS